MPNKAGALTPQEKRFAVHMARTGDHIYAAEKAGYAHPAARAHNNLAKPAVRAEIVARSEARLHNDLVPLALDTLHELMTAKGMHPKIRLDAAGKVMTHAKGAAASLARDEADWTLADIQARIRQVDAALADLNTIDHDSTETLSPAAVEGVAGGDLFA